jgi:predicted transglutaminase-like protease
MPAGYDAEKITQGINAMSHIKKEKCFVQLDKAIPRDEAMYNFDKDTIRKIMLNINREEFNFSSYLPCGMIKGINDSRISLASTAVSA